MFAIDKFTESKARLLAMKKANERAEITTKEYVRNSIAALQSSPYVSEIKTSVVLGGEYRFEWRYKGSDFMDVYNEAYNVAAHTPEQIASMCDNALSAIPV